MLLKENQKSFLQKNGKKIRLEKALPIINELGKWLHNERQQTLPSSPIGKAIAYTTALWDSLQNYLHNGNLNIDNNLIETPSDVTHFSKYSDDMRDLRDAYFDSLPNADKSKYYLFVVEGFNGGQEDGYMVRGKGVGFVSKTASPLTYAHELGHGAGALEHTWNKNGPPQGTTDNLMDYAGGNNLTLKQWKDLRKLNLIPSFWDSEEEGKLRLPNCLDTINLVGNFCMKDMLCNMKSFFKQAKLYSDSDTFRYLDYVLINFYDDSSFNNIYSSYHWKYNGQKILWSYSHFDQNGSYTGNTAYYFNSNDTLFCDGRITSYCADTIIIPKKLPTVYDYLAYVAFPKAYAKTGKCDESSTSRDVRFLLGDKGLQVGHTGVCIIKSDSILKRASIDYYDFGRFPGSNECNGIRRHFNLGYLQLILDSTDMVYKLEYPDSIEIRINNIDYFSKNLTDYGRKEIAIAPIDQSKHRAAYEKANSPFYESCPFGFGVGKSFCTSFVHDVFNEVGIPMTDISEMLNDQDLRDEMRDWFVKHFLHRNLLDYWDKGDKLLTNVKKSPLPINFAIQLKEIFSKYN